MILKTCECGAKYTLAEWLSLEWEGVYDTEDLDRVEQRRCLCGTSIGVLIRVEYIFPTENGIHA